MKMLLAAGDDGKTMIRFILNNGTIHIQQLETVRLEWRCFEHLLLNSYSVPMVEGTISWTDQMSWHCTSL